MKKATKKPAKISKKIIHAASAQSSKMEGVSLAKAKKNVAMIKHLRQYGRAFSL